VFETAVIILRWVQMTGAMILFGSSLFFLYAMPATGPGSAARRRWPRPVLLASASAVLVACLLGFLAQTAVLAGSLQDALQADVFSAAATGMSFGRSSIVRAIAAGFLVLALARNKPGLGTWRVATLAGGLICASFAWMGHGAATEGAAGLLHLFSDILHILAAGAWIGALVVFAVLLIAETAQDPEHRQGLYQALRGFSGLGSGLVAVLVATGVINSWFLVGVAGLPKVLTTVYGQLLVLKLALFLAILGLAATNRLYLTPRLGHALAQGTTASLAVAALRRSLVWETGLSIAVLALVAWLGTLPPPSVA
jgi:copper resistance protein D